jgi:ATP-binding cassette subfamily F protein uup
MLKPADILLLDEPTNDLDINSLDVLEASMADFSGALVLVTHDRHLLDRVCGQILSLDGRGNARYFADLDQWEDAQVDMDSSPALAPTPEPEPVKIAPVAPKKKSSKELKNLETKLHAAESERDKAKRACDDPAIASNSGELWERQQKLEAAQAKVDELFKQWEECAGS